MINKPKPPRSPIRRPGTSTGAKPPSPLTQVSKAPRVTTPSPSMPTTSTINFYGPKKKKKKKGSFQQVLSSMRNTPGYESRFMRFGS